LSDIGGVMVGGAIGMLGTVLGSVVTPYFLQRRKDVADKKRKRDEKFEELVRAVYEHDHWIDTKRRIQAAGYEGEISVSPFAKIHAVSFIYFPEFERAVEELRTASDKYGTWMLEAQAKRGPWTALDCILGTRPSWRCIWRS
jgi:hypothetical protein